MRERETDRRIGHIVIQHEIGRNTSGVRITFAGIDWGNGDMIVMMVGSIR